MNCTPKVRHKTFGVQFSNRNTFVRNSLSGNGVLTYRSAFTENLMSGE